MKKMRLVISAVGLASLIWFICYFPLPHYVWASCVIRPDNPQMVYVQEPGVLTKILVAPGDQVEIGQALAVIENREIQLEVTRLEGELKRLQSDLLSYELGRHAFPDSETKIVQTQVQIEGMSRQLETRRSQLSPLVLRASRGGIVVSPPNVARPADNLELLSSWHGTPLDQENQLAFLERGTLFCMIADEGAFEALLFVDQSDLTLLHSDQPVKILLEQYRDVVLSGQVANVAINETRVVPRELSQTNGGPIAVKPTAAGAEEPVLKQFEVHTSISNNELTEKKTTLMSGYFGTAKVRVGTTSLGVWALRYFRNLINFR